MISNAYHLGQSAAGSIVSPKRRFSGTAGFGVDPDADRAQQLDYELSKRWWARRSSNARPTD